jgi:hypothetical protein
MLGVSIDVPSDLTDQSARLRFTVDRTELLRADADPEDIAILRATDNGYKILETTATDESGDVIVEATTPGFSDFIVSTDEGDIGIGEPATGETDPEPEEQQPVEPDNEDGEDSESATSPEPTETPVSEELGSFNVSDAITSGPGVILILLVVLILALTAIRRRNR